MSDLQRLYEMTPRELEAEAEKAEERGDTRWAQACREEANLTRQVATAFTSTEIQK